MLKAERGAWEGTLDPDAHQGREAWRNVRLRWWLR